MCFPTVAGMIRNRSIRKICPRDSRARRPACVRVSRCRPARPPGTRGGQGGPPRMGGLGLSPGGAERDGRGAGQSLGQFLLFCGERQRSRALPSPGGSEKTEQQRAQRIQPRSRSRLPAGPGRRRGNRPRPGREGQRAGASPAGQPGKRRSARLPSARARQFPFLKAGTFPSPKKELSDGWGSRIARGVRQAQPRGRRSSSSGPGPAAPAARAGTSREPPGAAEGPWS